MPQAFINGYTRCAAEYKMTQPGTRNPFYRATHTIYMSAGYTYTVRVSNIRRNDIAILVIKHKTEIMCIKK